MAGELKMSNISLDLQVRREDVATQDRQGVYFKGFFAERVIVGGEVAYDYEWVGARHYLAIHDIDLKEGEIQIDGAAAQFVTDLRGCMTFAPKGCLLSGWVSTAKRMNAFTSITFDPDIVAAELESSRATLIGEKPMVHFRDTGLESTLWKLDSALRDPSGIDALYMETLALAALMELNHVPSNLARRFEETGRLSVAKERRIREFIHDNLNTNLGLAEMAESVGLSRFHFSRAFKATFGLSPRDYVLWARVEAAKLMLSQTEDSVAEIARKVGFGSSDRLAFSFRRFIDQTPTQFRRTSN
jgi:AraC family transcriptional regulator